MRRSDGATVVGTRSGGGVGLLAASAQRVVLRIEPKDSGT